jgi:hypothetical protein
MEKRLCGTQTDWPCFEMPVIVSRVPPDMLEHFWEEVEEFINLARRIDTHESNEEIKEKIANCVYQLWVAIDVEIICAMVTMLLDRGHEKVLHVEYAGAIKNSMRFWKEKIVDALTDFAKQHGAVALECAGRTGWQAIFPEAKVISVKIRKELQ